MWRYPAIGRFQAVRDIHCPFHSGFALELRIILYISQGNIINKFSFDFIWRTLSLVWEVLIFSFSAENRIKMTASQTLLWNFWKSNITLINRISMFSSAIQWINNVIIMWDDYRIFFGGLSKYVYEKHVVDDILCRILIWRGSTNLTHRKTILIHFDSKVGDLRYRQSVTSGQQSTQRHAIEVSHSAIEDAGTLRQQNMLLVAMSCHLSHHDSLTQSWVLHTHTLHMKLNT